MHESYKIRPWARFGLWYNLLTPEQRIWSTNQKIQISQHLSHFNSLYYPSHPIQPTTLWVSRNGFCYNVLEVICYPMLSNWYTTKVNGVHMLWCRNSITTSIMKCTQQSQWSCVQEYSQKYYFKHQKIKTFKYINQRLNTFILLYLHNIILFSIKYALF